MLLRPVSHVFRSKLEIVRLVRVTRLCSDTGIGTFLIDTVHGVVAGVIVATAVDSLVTREHKVCLPALDRLKSYVTRELHTLGLVLTRLFFLQRDGVPILQKLTFVVRAVTVPDRRCRVTDDSLAIDGRSITDVIFILFGIDLDVDLQHVVEHPVAHVEVSAQRLVTRLLHHTLRVAVSEIAKVGCLGIATTHGDTMVMGHSCTTDSFEPIGVVALIVEVSLSGSYIRSIHEVSLFSPTGE